MPTTGASINRPSRRSKSCRRRGVGSSWLLAGKFADLQKVFDRLDLFELVVAENGALIYRPATREERALVDAPSERFVEELKRRGVERISVGRCIVATWQPYEKIVLETIRDLGLELQVIFNKGAVMVLPGGMNKASGLKAALAELHISLHNTVGVGDAENDHAFLSICECSAAVANALPAVKDTADVVLKSDHGAGVTELIREMLADDLAEPRQPVAKARDPAGQGQGWRRADCCRRMASARSSWARPAAASPR